LIDTLLAHVLLSLFSETASKSSSAGAAGSSSGRVTRRESMSEDGDVVARIQNATQNVMGRISGMGRLTGGFANKLGGGILKF